LCIHTHTINGAKDATFYVDNLLGLRGKKMTTVRQKWSHTGTCGERGRAGEKTKKKGEKGEKKWKGLKRSGCKK
jgi:hypothetical protein